MLENGWALLGELTKILPVSETRFTSFVQSSDVYVVSLAGVPGETVSITAFDTNSGKTDSYSCTIGPGGNSRLYFPNGSCMET